MWIRFIRFFIPPRGPGFILVVIGAFLGFGYFWGSARERNEARARARMVTRQLGQPDNGPDVDPGQAPRGSTLLDRRTGNLWPQQPDKAPVRMPDKALAAVPAMFVYDAPATPKALPAVQPTPAPKPEPKVWLPLGTPIRCMMWGAAESSNGLEAPILGIVIEDVWQNCDGIRRKVIPRDTLVKCWANSGAVRNRVRVSGRWVMTFVDGRSLKFDGVALACQLDATGTHVGLENATGGMIGVEVETDPAAKLEALIPLFITAVLNGVQNSAGAVLQASGSAGVYQVPDTTPIVGKYLDQLMHGLPDTKYVRVDAGSQFYVFSAETIDPASRTIFCDSGEKAPGIESAIDPVSQAVKAVQQTLSKVQAKPEGNPTNEDSNNHVHF